MIWDILQQTGFNQYFQESKLSTLTTETLLLDENIITQFKNLNPKLIEYIENHKDEFISKLIFYTIVLPEQHDNQDRMKKLPYVSSEVLAIDNSIVYKSLLEGENNYFAELMRIFSTKASQNQILLGYFVKILQNLYKCQKKKTAKKIYEFRQTFYNHLNKQSVGTILKLFIILLQTQEGFMLSERKQVIQNIINQLVQQSQVRKNVCKDILVEVITKFQTFSSGDEILHFILQSQKILTFFQFKESESIDQFFIGYMSKALQKICTSGQQKKSLIQISELHKQKIKDYIKSKKNILNKHHQNLSFNNQSKQKVYKLDKYLYTYLVLIKLALENQITQIIQEGEIISLFELLFLHPTNDILKVKIFDIFSLIYFKKDDFSKQLFEKHFSTKSIQLFEKDKKMYGYFLYQLWKNINKKLLKPLNIVPQLNQKWNQLLKYFALNDSYQNQAQKVVDRYSNKTKAIKLVVDQQDTAPPVVPKQTGSFKSQKQQDLLVKEIQNKLQIKQTVNQQEIWKAETTIDKKQQIKFDFSFEDFSQSINTSKQEINKQTLKADPFAAFQFFDAKPAKSEQKKAEVKKADFSDFNSFF